MKVIRGLVLALVYGGCIGVTVAAFVRFGATVGLMIGFFAVPLALIVTGMLLRGRANGGLFGRKKQQNADQIDAGFECPYCGARFSFSRKSCPTCGKDLKK